MSRNYHALVANTSRDRDALLHLVRDDAEASLCGIPRSTLGPATHFVELVCPECIEWLPRRIDFSEAHPKVKQS